MAIELLSIRLIVKIIEKSIQKATFYSFLRLIAHVNEDLLLIFSSIFIIHLVIQYGWFKSDYISSQLFLWVRASKVSIQSHSIAY